MRGDRLLLLDTHPAVVLLSREMLPSLRDQFVSLASLGCDDDSLAPNNTSNLRHRNACNAKRNTASARHAKEQLVVFPAVQSEAQINLLGGFSDDCPWD